MTQSVLVLGSQGVLGSLVADAFARDDWTVTRAGRRAEAPAGVRHVDLARPETLDDVLDDVKPDLVVSSVPDAALTAERAILRRGGLLLNTSTIAAAAIRRLRAGTASVADGRPYGTVVAHAGIAPGLVNLVAASLLAQYPDADEIEMAVTNSLNGNVGPAGADGAHAALTAGGRHPTTVVPLPKPIGRARCLRFDELAGWFGPIADGRTLSVYSCLIPKPARYALLAANAAGLLGRIPRKAIATNRPSTPSAASREPVAHWIAVRAAGTLLAARTIRCHGDYRSSAATTALFARALTRPESPPPPGALFPEEALALADLHPNLATAGITIQEEWPDRPR